MLTSTPARCPLKLAKQLSAGQPLAALSGILLQFSSATAKAAMPTAICCYSLCSKRLAPTSVGVRGGALWRPLPRHHLRHSAVATIWRQLDIEESPSTSLLYVSRAVHFPPLLFCQVLEVLVVGRTIRLANHFGLELPMATVCRYFPIVTRNCVAFLRRLQAYKQLNPIIMITIVCPNTSISRQSRQSWRTHKANTATHGLSCVRRIAPSRAAVICGTNYMVPPFGARQWLHTQCNTNATTLAVCFCIFYNYFIVVLLLGCKHSAAHCILSNAPLSSFI